VVNGADIPLVEVDGRVAMAGDQPDLVTEPEPAGRGRNGEAAVLVRGALIGREGPAVAVAVAAVIGVHEDI
jgi:hypothetical protein